MSDVGTPENFLFPLNMCHGGALKKIDKGNISFVFIIYVHTVWFWIGLGFLLFYLTVHNLWFLDNACMSRVLMVCSSSYLAAHAMC